ncbi:MAG: thioesterase family protein [Nocardioidaceae bacterium]|nr:thioesterase family protein [Nocardioidaceae bacterium]MCL2613436.1 thioesterase family protein [Nocardioidaceae bacterium]
MAYWKRTGGSTFVPTEHVGGAWNLREQHIAPALGLLAHAVELDRDERRSDGLLVSRASYDILGAVPLDEMEISVDVVRPGRTIELVRAEARHGGRSVVTARFWLIAPNDTSALAGSGLPPVPGPDRTPAWDMTTLWPGGFIASLEVRRTLLAEGRSITWARTPHDLVADEPVSRFAAVAGLLDLTNGIATRADPKRVAFPNIDLTAHFLREPVDGWLGLDTTVSFGPTGLGITSSVTHDESGPFATTAQTLTVRP